MTQVTLNDIRQSFADLISGHQLRENIEAWAFSLMKKGDEGLLSYEPTDAESQIWEALTYFSGVALKTSEKVYLHTTEDFISYFQEWKLRLKSSN